MLGEAVNSELRAEESFSCPRSGLQAWSILGPAPLPTVGLARPTGWAGVKESAGTPLRPAQPQITFDYSGVVGEVGGGAFEDEFTRFKHIAAIGNVQRRTGVLFH